MAAKKLPGEVAPKKAAKKVAKKAAKKVAAKAAKKSAKGPGHDIRRAYEHLHRLHVLARALSAEELTQVQVLARFAQGALREEHPETAADLLRAAEHLAFASMSREADNTAPSDALKETLKDEYERMLERAAADWEAQDPGPARALRAVYKAARAGAKEAWKARVYQRAIEFARAADALAHAAPGDLRVTEGDREGSDLLA